MKTYFLSILTVSFFALNSCQAQKENNIHSSNMKTPEIDSTTGFNKLTPQEQAVLVNKSTDHPFTGDYYKKKDVGIYICRRCNAHLYNSKDKFDSHCGWPSFDEEVEGAVTRVPDADGMRVEIICKNCGGHLGHVFEGEGFTEKDTRHCVNTSSILFIPAAEVESAPKVIKK